MHGDQPKPNATPATIGAAVPNVPSCGWNRFSWYSHGARRNSEPSRNNAIANITVPDRRVSMALCRDQLLRSVDADRPSSDEHDAEAEHEQRRRRSDAREVAGATRLARSARSSPVTIDR